MAEIISKIDFIGSNTLRFLLGIGIIIFAVKAFSSFIDSEIKDGVFWTILSIGSLLLAIYCVDLANWFAPI